MGMDQEKRWVHRTAEGAWCYGEATPPADLPYGPFEGANEPDAPASPADPAGGSGEPRPVAGIDAVFAFARECGYPPERVPAILGARDRPLTLPDFLMAGGTAEQAIERLRQYHQMDRGPGRR